MPFTTDHLQALEDALASGEKIVRFGDRWIEYRSIDELQAAITRVKADIASQSGPRVRHIRIQTSKGF